MRNTVPDADRASQPSQLIEVSAVVLYRPDGQVLTVRKAGTSMFMFPGGKRQEGETALEAALRELSEETHLTVNPQDLEHLGFWDTPAANEEGHRLHSEVFALLRPLARNEVPEPHAEIEQLLWMDPAAPAVPAGHGLAPLLVEVLQRIASDRTS
jgi:8-oxo-dGTP diphosphatase